MTPSPPVSLNAPLPPHKRRGVRQFIKFGIVGASSTIINFAVLNFALIGLHFKDIANGRYASATLAFLVSVVNGYVWNKRWTFKEAQAKAVHTQFTQFALVNLVGLALDLLLIRLISVPLETRFGFSLVVATNIAQLFATGIVVFWNFFANRFWTFKH